MAHLSPCSTIDTSRVVSYLPSTAASSAVLHSGSSWFLCTATRSPRVPLHSLSLSLRLPPFSLEYSQRPFICWQTKHQSHNSGYSWISRARDLDHFITPTLLDQVRMSIFPICSPFDLPHFVSSALCDIYYFGLSLAYLPNLQTSAVSHS
jgi:hypothetical protein